jgi:hypothetical protein
MGRGGIAVCRGSIAVDPQQVLLKFDRADSGVYLQRTVEVGVVRARHIGEERRGPRAGVAAVRGQTIIDLQRVACGERNQYPLTPHLDEIGVVLNAIEALAVSNLILMQEDLVGTFQGWRNDEASTLVVEQWKDGRGRGLVGNAFQLRLLRRGSDDADDRNRLGSGTVSARGPVRA